MTDTATDLRWDQVLAWRTRRHHLEERAARDRLLDVVGAIGCLHAQLLASAELSLWARVDGVVRDELDGLLWDEHSSRPGRCAAPFTCSPRPSTGRGALSA